MTTELPIDHNDQELGNTNSSSIKGRNRGYVFTINNYDLDQIQNLESLAKRPEVDWMIVGKEVGKKGTPHLQGAIYYKTLKSFNQVKEQLGNKAHIEKMKGKKEDQCYCEKDGNVIIRKNFNFDEDPWDIDNPFENMKPLEWQQKLLDEITPYKEVKRKIIWICDPEGGKGKSTFEDHMIAAHGALSVAGKASDIYCALALMKENGEEPPKYIIWDLPRQCMGQLSYVALEKLKDGIVFSGKYKSGMIKMRRKPTIIILANEEPKYELLTSDRWDVRHI